MLHKLKRRLYFAVAAYFAFWAKMVLRRWNPYVVVVTGSSGKTTTLHLVEAQLGSEAVYSHHANSAIGVPFHLLGLPNITGKSQWLSAIVKAPFKSGRKAPDNKIYVVEADCDRPNEGKFLAGFLRPKVTLWVSVYRTHSMNFERLVASGAFATTDEAIAHEFGYFAAATTQLVVAGDQPLIKQQLERVKADVRVETVSADVGYTLEAQRTAFTYGNKTVNVPGLHPKEVAVGLQLVDALLDELQLSLDPNYTKFQQPPGRSSIFAGVKGTVLIDSTYNTGLEAMVALLDLFKVYPSERKWLIIGDMLEQGKLEQAEHERLGEALQKMTVDRIVLLGPRTRQYTLPLLQGSKVESFEKPGEVLTYLQAELQGGEALLFKGGRYLEGVIEPLLADPSEASQLVRRGAAWAKRRQSWGLPG